MHSGKVSGCVFDSGLIVGGASPSATVMTDKSRFHNNGTIGSPDWVQLKSGLWVQDFDGATDKVVVADSASLSGLGPLTVMCWANQDIQGTEGLVSKMSSADPSLEWTLYLHNTGGALRFILYSAVSANYLIAVGTNNVSRNWYYLAGTWDGTNAISHIILYVNGVSETLTANTKNGSGYVPHDETSVVEIGRDWGTNVDCFDGRIAGVRIFNRALSAAEIRNIYSRERGLFGV